MKRNNKRKKSKLPGLNKNLNLKVRQELIDYDYIDKLSESEKEWLNKFTEEYVNASFKKTKSGNYSSKNLHKTKQERKDCYDRNNARNRDVFGITKINNMLKDADSVQSVMEDKSLRSASQVEDDIINLLDIKKGEDL